MTDISLPIDLFDSSGFLWDVQGDGNISNGTDDAYDGGLRLNNFDFFDNAQTEDNDREIAIGSSIVGDVQITRKVYVPENQSFARFLEIVTNTGSSTADFTVSLDTNLGSDSETFVVDTASGDTFFNTDDNWIVTDDFDNGGDPTMLHIIAGEGGEIRPNAASLNFDDINFAYNLNLAPGETQIIIHFAAQNTDQANALAKAPELAALELDALAGMSDDELRQVLNFSTAPLPPLIGTAGDDVLTGTNRRDIISGLGGSDIIQGLAGNDEIAGGNDGDLIDAGNGNDTVTGEGGLDDILGGNGDDVLDGGSDADRILGGSGNDNIGGSIGNDTIDGGEDNDSLYGGGDSDLLFGGSGEDSLSGGAAADNLAGGFGSDSLDGGDDNDRLTGVDPFSPASEVGFGAGEVDTLTGGAGSDIFVLGDENRLFYDDGDPLTIGQSDLALIADFDSSQDSIQLNGSEEFYNLDFFTSGAGTINADLIFDNGVSARGEVIATLQNVSPELSVADPAFTFV